MLVLFVAMMIPFLGIFTLNYLGVIDFKSDISEWAVQQQEAGRAIMPRFFVYFLIIAVIAGIISGILVSFRLTAPIAQLAKSVKDFGEKDLVHQLDIKGPDEIQELASAFNQLTINLAHAEQLRQNLLADVSHELRTPLTVLEGQLRAALDNVMELSGEEIANMYHQTQHLIYLVRDLHELAQAEAEKLPLEFYPTDINRLIGEVYEIFHPLVAEKNIKLELKLAHSLPEVNVDAYRIRQVLHNLIGNALKYTSEKGLIVIASKHKDAGVEIKVSDDGEGIHPDHLLNVFDRFYREDRSRNRATGGSGLGLSIVKALIEIHGGIVNVTSPGKGKGSTFSIFLPVEK
jgi:two-component system OmpR family sensor kinase/two-component system sensor histidine kinase BaeS